MEVPRQSVVESSAASSRIRILQQGRHHGTAGAEAERIPENQVSVCGSLSRPESSQITRQESPRTPEGRKYPMSYICKEESVRYNIIDFQCKSKHNR